MGDGWKYWKSGPWDCFVKKFDDTRQYVARIELELPRAKIWVESRQLIATEDEAIAACEEAVASLTPAIDCQK